MATFEQDLCMLFLASTSNELNSFQYVELELAINLALKNRAVAECLQTTVICLGGHLACRIQWRILSKIFQVFKRTLPVHVSYYLVFL